MLALHENFRINQHLLWTSTEKKSLHLNANTEAGVYSFGCLISSKFFGMKML